MIFAISPGPLPGLFIERPVLDPRVVPKETKKRPQLGGSWGRSHRGEYAAYWHDHDVDLQSADPIKLGFSGWPVLKTGVAYFDQYPLFGAGLNPQWPSVLVLERI
jgi:hypothetical protein